MMKNGNAEYLELFALGDMLREYGGQKIAADLVRSGGTKADFMAAIAERSRREPLAKAADRLLGFDSQVDGFGYSITRALRAGLERNWSGAGLENRVSELSMNKTERVPNGFFVPLGVLARDFNAGTANQAGNLMNAKTVIGDLVNDPVRKIAALGRMGATILTGLKSTLDVPRFESSSSATWLSEVGTAGAVLTSSTNVSLTPKRTSVTMVLSRQALIQTTPELDAAIGRHLIKVLMEQAENGALNGDGTSDSPVGLRSTANVGAVVGGTDGLLLNYGHLCDLEDKPAAANTPESEFGGYIINSKTRRYLRTYPKGTNLDYAWVGGERPLLGYRAAVSNLLPADNTKGASGAVCSSLVFSNDWSQFILGIYGGGVDVMVDRVTLADQGKVKIVAALEIGVGAALPASFSMMNDAKLA